MEKTSLKISSRQVSCKNSHSNNRLRFGHPFCLRSSWSSWKNYWTCTLLFVPHFTRQNFLSLTASKFGILLKALLDLAFLVSLTAQSLFSFVSLQKCSSTIVVPTPVATCSVLSFRTFRLSSETTCQNAVHFTAAVQLVNCYLRMSWQNAHRTRQTWNEYTVDILIVHRMPRRWSTLKSETIQRSKAARTQETTKLHRLQSGERARTTPTTENTCSSPGYPATTDLSHCSPL